jgi:hypothetical protein
LYIFIPFCLLPKTICYRGFKSAHLQASKQKTALFLQQNINMKIKTAGLVSILLPVLATAARDNPFNPKTSAGTTGPFTPAKKPSPSANGAPATVDAATAQKMQAACDSWTADTGMVSNFQNIGKGTAAGPRFNAAAKVAYNVSNSYLLSLSLPLPRARALPPTTPTNKKNPRLRWMS